MPQEVEQLQQVYSMVTEFAVNYSFQIVGALVILAVGAWVAGKIGRMIEQLMRNKDIDVTLSRFTGGMVKIFILILVVIVALSNLGISVTPFLAAVGAIGLGAGLAVQGMLSNYAAGFTIILTRPFVVGDTIRVQDVAGVVDEVHLGYTILLDEDNVRIQIPNRHVVGEILHNSAAQMLIELSIGVAYSSDTQQVIDLIKRALGEVEGVDMARGPIIGIDNFGDSSINFGVRFWAPTVRHYEIRFAANKAIHDAILADGVEIPYPQREVRMLSDVEQPAR